MPSASLYARAATFAVRKRHLLLRATALVAVPGGYGTLDEVFETLALVQARTLAVAVDHFAVRGVSMREGAPV